MRQTVALVRVQCRERGIHETEQQKIDACTRTNENTSIFPSEHRNPSKLTQPIFPPWRQIAGRPARATCEVVFESTEAAFSEHRNHWSADPQNTGTTGRRRHAANVFDVARHAHSSTARPGRLGGHRLQLHRDDVHLIAVNHVARRHPEGTVSRAVLREPIAMGWPNVRRGIVKRGDLHITIVVKQSCKTI